MPSGRHEYDKSSMASWSWKESRLERIVIGEEDFPSKKKSWIEEHTVCTVQLRFLLNLSFRTIELVSEDNDR